MKDIGFKYVATTPTALNDATRAFCRHLSTEEPVFLNISYDPNAGMGRCYDNAASAAKRLAGKTVFGWLLWELQGVYVTAEHHAVIEVGGQLIDITPPLAGETKVVFVPDRISDFRPPRPANRYGSLVSHPLIGRYVELARRNSQLELAGKAFGMEYRLNDNEMTRLLDRYFSRSKTAETSLAQRKRKKEERRRKKQGRKTR